MTLARIIKEVIRQPVEGLLRVYLWLKPSREYSPDRVKRVLVFAYHGLGNFIMYTPALRRLRERFPDARIDLQVGNDTGCEAVLDGSGLFDHVYNMPHTVGLLRLWQRAREIRRARYDVTINEFHSHSWKLALLVVAGGAPFRIGHVTSPGWSRRFSRYSFVFNIPVAMGDDEHEIDRYLDLVEALGSARSDVNSERVSIHLTETDREFARSFLEGAHYQPGRLILGVQAGTSPAMRWKQWPVERFRELVERLLAEMPEAYVVLFGSATEAEMVRDIADGLGPRAIVAAGKTTVKQVAALIERCNILVCNDSGLMHVAVAVGTPVVAIYGPTDIRRTAPMGEQHTVIRHPLPCSPCFKLEGDDQVHLCPHHDCLMTITTDEVFNIVSAKAALHTPLLNR